MLFSIRACRPYDSLRLGGIAGSSPPSAHRMSSLCDAMLNTRSFLSCCDLIAASRSQADLQGDVGNLPAILAVNPHNQLKNKGNSLKSLRRNSPHVVKHLFLQHNNFPC